MKQVGLGRNCEWLRVAGEGSVTSWDPQESLGQTTAK